MPVETEAAVADESRLDAALAEYMERSDLGEAVDRAGFLEKYADIRVELSAFFRVSDQLADAQLGQLLEGRKPKSLAESLAALPRGIPVPPVAMQPVAVQQPTATTASKPVSPKSPADKSPTEKSAKATGAPTSDAQASEPADQPVRRRSSLFRRLCGLQPMMVSAVLHLIVLLVLAAITLPLPDFQQMIVPIHVEQVDSDEIREIEPLAKIELPQTETDATEAVQSASNLSESMDVSSLNDEPSSIRADLSDVGSQHAMSLETLVRSPGEGRGLGKAGMGKVKFFGQSSSGKRFVFVIDNSGSMTKGRFETALYELQMAVEYMTPTQMFYVVFFSDTAYPLFHPEPAPGFVPATNANKQKLAVWLRTVETCLRTEAQEAMQKSIDMRPDVIYLLGDGAFTDKTSDYLAKLPGGPQIHVLGMEVGAKHAAAFQDIATKFKGTYKDVGIRPEMAAVAKTEPRPFNKKRGSVWGLKLPQ